MRGRIIEILSEMLIKFDQQHEDFNDIKAEFKDLKNEFKELRKEVGGKLSNVEDQIIKLNLISSENSRSLMKLAENNDRIMRLEKAVFK